MSVFNIADLEFWQLDSFGNFNWSVAAYPLVPEDIKRMLI